MKYEPVDLTRWKKRKYPQDILDRVQAFCDEWKVTEVLFLSQLNTNTGTEYRLMYKDGAKAAGIEWFR